MRSKLIWEQTLRNDAPQVTNSKLTSSLIATSKLATNLLSSSNNISTAVTAIAFNNTCSELLVSNGKAINVYSVRDGSQLTSLLGHHNTVTCLAYSRDGKWFASGSLDKYVTVWNSNRVAFIKYNHSEAIKCLTFNPITHHLLATTSNDFSFWYTDCRNVNKISVSTINCASWSSDGHIFALGLREGYISLRNRSGVELNRIALTHQLSSVSKYASKENDSSFLIPQSSASILSIAFSPRKSDQETDVIAITDSNQMLSFYDINGKQIGKEKYLAFYSLCIEFSLDGNLLILSGSNSKCNICTRDGIYIDSFGNKSQLSWTSRCTFDSSASKVASSTQSAEISLWDVSFATVHSLYRGLYAYRNRMTDVVIHNLLTEDMVCIKCHDVVKKLAIYKDRLAIQLSDKLVIYELTWKKSVESNSSPVRSVEEKRSSKFGGEEDEEDGEDEERVEGRGRASPKEQEDGEEEEQDKRVEEEHEKKKKRKKRRNISKKHYDEKNEDKLQQSVRMHYKVCSRISYKFDCTLMVVGSNCVIFCQKRRLQCINFQGLLEREWTVDSHICYVRFTGGPCAREGLLIGLKSGQILQIFVNNPFPLTLMTVSASVVCLDLSPNRRQLAVVDERGFCSVFDIRSKQLLYEASSDTGANSVAWNSQFDNMLAYIGSQNLCVKSDNHLVYQQSLKGFVVGFCGCKVFCLIGETVITVEVSQTTSMNKFIEDEKFDLAYKVACLGVTQEDWNRLGHASLQSLKLSVSRKSFIETYNYRQIECINYIENSQEYSKVINSSATIDNEGKLILLGHYHAYSGLYNAAVKSYKSANRVDLAINMLTDLKMFDQAQSLIKTLSETKDVSKSLTIKQADWINNMNEPRTAAEMYLTAGDTGKAIELAGKHGWIDLLVQIATICDKGDRINLSTIGEHLVKHKQYFQAIDVYKKIGDTNNLANVYILSKRWQDALTLAKEYPALKEMIYAPYARHLTSEGRFSEAQIAFHEAGMLKQALTTLQTLISNAISLNNFADAGYYTWILSQQCLDLAKKASSSSSVKYLSLVSQYTQLEAQAEMYYAYERIYRFVEQPFTAYFADSLFNAARFLYHSLFTSETEQKEPPPGISQVIVLYALAKQSCNLGAYKLARLVYEKLQSYHIPSRFVSTVELGDLTIRGKPFSDAEDLLPLCYRCSTTNPLSNGRGNRCVNCQQAFHFSFSNFDVLPLIPFQLEESISDEEALQLIHTNDESNLEQVEANDAPSVSNATQDQEQELNNQYQDHATSDFLSVHSSTHDTWRDERSKDHQSLTIQHLDATAGKMKSVDFSSSSNLEESIEDDPFTLKITTVSGVEDTLYPEKVTVNRSVLSKLSKNEVLYHRNPLDPSRYYFYRNIVPDMFIVLCSHCNHFFLDDIETHLLLQGTCAFCRNAMKLSSSLV